MVVSGIMNFFSIRRPKACLGYVLAASVLCMIWGSIPLLSRPHYTLDVDVVKVVEPNEAKGSFDNISLSQNDDPFHWDEAIHLAGNVRLGKAYLTIGLPTTRRKKVSYLNTTLTSLLTNSDDGDRRQMIVVIFLADTNHTYAFELIQYLNTSFPEHLHSGYLRVITAPTNYYPDLSEDKLKRTYGDDIKRVKWRSKQNLDYAFLMHYCRSISQYYLQIEDDVTAISGYFRYIHNYINTMTKKVPEWTMLEFSKMGYIGKLYHSYDLPKLAYLLRVFYNEQPCDYIQIRFLEIMLQKKKYIHNPVLFHHIGYFSTLENQFRDVSKKIPNPQADLYTDIEAYGKNTLTSVYTGKGMFWGKNITEGRSVTIVFKQPTNVKQIVIVTGNKNNLSLDPVQYAVLNYGSKVQGKDCDDYRFLASFINGTVAYDRGVLKDVQCLQIRVAKTQEKWMIISKMDILF